MQHGRRNGRLFHRNCSSRIGYVGKRCLFHPAVEKASRRARTLRSVFGFRFLQLPHLLVHAPFWRTIEALRLRFHLTEQQKNEFPIQQINKDIFVFIQGEKVSIYVIPHLRSTLSIFITSQKNILQFMIFSTLPSLQ